MMYGDEQKITWYKSHWDIDLTNTADVPPINAEYIVQESFVRNHKKSIKTNHAK